MTEAPSLPPADRFIGEGECRRITNLSRTTRWRMERVGEFPARRKISKNRIGWRLSEIENWLESRRSWR